MNLLISNRLFGLIFLSLSAYPDSTNSKSPSGLIQPTQFQPAGVKEIVDYDWPEHWDNTVYNEEKGLRVSDSATLVFQKFYENIQWMESQSRDYTGFHTSYRPDDLEPDSVAKLALRYLRDTSIHAVSQFLPVQEWKMGNQTLVLYHSKFQVPKQGPAEYRYYYSRSDLVLYDAQGEQVDHLIVQYLSGDDIGSHQRHFYIDQELNIWLCNFFNNELGTYYSGKTLWMINPEGRFEEMKGKD